MFRRSFYADLFLAAVELAVVVLDSSLRTEANGRSRTGFSLWAALSLAASCLLVAEELCRRFVNYFWADHENSYPRALRTHIEYTPRFFEARLGKLVARCFRCTGLLNDAPPPRPRPSSSTSSSSRPSSMSAPPPRRPKKKKKKKRPGGNRPRNESASSSEEAAAATAPTDTTSNSPSSPPPTKTYPPRTTSSPPAAPNVLNHYLSDDNDSGNRRVSFFLALKSPQPRLLSGASASSLPSFAGPHLCLHSRPVLSRNRRPSVLSIFLFSLLSTLFYKTISSLSPRKKNKQ